MKDLKRAVLVAACTSALYIAVSGLLSITEFSLRTWVDIMGKVTAGLILPLLLLILLLSWVHRRDCDKKWFLVGIAIAGYALFSRFPQKLRMKPR